MAYDRAASGGGDRTRDGRGDADDDIDDIDDIDDVDVVDEMSRMVGSCPGLSSIVATNIMNP